MDKELSNHSDYENDLEEEFPEDGILGEDLDDEKEEEEKEEDDEFSEE